MRSRRRKRAAIPPGIHATPRASHARASDSTLRGTYWFDLRIRHPAGAVVKRGLDVALSTLAIAMLSPLFAVTIAALVLTRGKAMSAERCIGMRGHRFDAYRFAAGPAWLSDLPRLFNVMEGSMSLVGPRAVADDTPEADALESHMRRFALRPGITGPWRLHGMQTAAEALAADREYVNSWSVSRDLAILFRTLTRS